MPQKDTAPSIQFGVFTVGDVTTDPGTGRTPTLGVTGPDALTGGVYVASKGRGTEGTASHGQQESWWP
ncbi:hypothetical protein AB0L35_38395 [Streptomyces sp. NPDC052309]|uniref:hypothetical protein n=1 Tax=Streptomyces sp. NPDC052309 TaxID=3155421 RepID=UPI003445B288